MEFSGEFETDVEPAELWAYFTDTDILAEAGPGVEEMHLVSPWEIETVLSVGVGSFKPTFDVQVDVIECERPDELAMQATGSAARNEFEATASMELEGTDGGTRAVWTAEADVSGLIASLGQRALGSVTDRLVNDFFDDIERFVEEGVEAESELRANPEAEINT
jgi:carbon monoxide dehydrogenase subunit G